MLYGLVNIFSQLTAEGLEQVEERSHVAMIGFPVRLKNAGQAYLRILREAIIHVPHILVFIGMMDYTLASIHNLLDDDTSDGSSLELGPYSSEHPSWECNVVDVTNAPNIEEATTHTLPDQQTTEQHEAYAQEQAESLKARRVELEAERWQLEQEQAELEPNDGNEETPHRPTLRRSTTTSFREPRTCPTMRGKVRTSPRNHDPLLHPRTD